MINWLLNPVLRKILIVVSAIGALGAAFKIYNRRVKKGAIRDYQAKVQKETERRVNAGREVVAKVTEQLNSGVTPQEIIDRNTAKWVKARR